MNALRALEHAVAAPLPRRHRTWVHRVSVALDALAEALRAQRADDDDRVGPLTEVALGEPTAAARVEALRREMLDLSVAVASLRERIEPDPVIAADPDVVRDQLVELTRRFAQLQTDRATLIREALG